MIVVAYTGIPRIYAPLWEKMDAMEYTITIDGTKVTDSGKTSFQIAGDNSTLNVDIEYGSNQVSIVPRTAAEKALSSLVFHSPLVFMKSVGENTVTAWCDDSSDEYYLEVMSMANGELEVSDNHGSVFHTIEKSQPESSVPVYQYYAYIGNLDESHVLTINGIETHLS